MIGMWDIFNVQKTGWSFNVFYLMLLYLFIILISLISHLVLFLLRKLYQPIKQRKKERWIILLHRCQEQGEYAVSISKLRRLKNDISLAAWDEALLDGLSEGVDVNRFLKENSKALISIGLHMKREPVRAYYAWIFSDLEKHGVVLSKDYYKIFILDLRNSDSIYTRENALKAIYWFNETAFLTDAWVTLSHRHLYHSSKLLANDLLEAGGNAEDHAKGLMENYNALEACFRVAVINYLRYEHINTWDKALAGYLQSEESSTYVKCCIIRKLGTSGNADNAGVLLEVLRKNGNAADWEPAAVAASMLRYFPSAETEKGLLESLRSPSWYVRTNAASALVDLGINEEQKHVVLLGNDAYARDALLWALSKKADEKAGRFGRSGKQQEQRRL